MDSFLSFLIKSDFVRAQVLAVVRHVVTAAGAAAIAKGYADSSMVEGVMGFATSAVGFYLANLDVHKVDTKIQVALATPSTLSEEEQTRALNILQHKGSNVPSVSAK